MKQSVYAAAILVTVALSLPAWGLELGVRGYVWTPELSGDIRIDDDALAGTKLDFVDTLGLDDESSAVIEVFVAAGRHHIMLGYHQADYKGNKVLDQDVVFNGEVYHASDTIRSELEFTAMEGMYQYDVIDLENILAGFSIGLVGKVKVLKGSAQIESELTGEQTEKDFTAPIPMLGANVHVGLINDLLEARVLATGMGYSGNTVMDAQAELSLTPFPFLDLTGGYRFFNIDVDEDDVEFKYDTSGPYIGVAIKF